MSSLWDNLNTRFTDDGNRSVALYQADSEGFDVGSILAAARSDLPFMDPSKLVHDTVLGAGTTFEVSRELFYTPERKLLPVQPYYVAVKQVRLRNKTPEAKRQLLRSVMREIRVMMHPALRDHACIVPIIAYGWKNDPRDGAIPYLVTDYTAHGTMIAYLQRCKTSPYERRELALDIAIGLSALHANGIVHGDVKQANVLVYGNTGLSPVPAIAKLADFGSVILVENWEKGPVSYLGTPIYNAPELQGWDAQTEATQSLTFHNCCKADVYSYGLLLWEVINGGGSFLQEIKNENANTSLEALRLIHNGNVDALLDYALASWMARGIQGNILLATEGALKFCLRDDPAKRSVMESVTAELGKGTTLVRDPPTYPLPLETPLLPPPTQIEIKPPQGYYTRSSAPDIAIPIPSRMNPGEPYYIKRFDAITGRWLSTTELDPYKFDRKILPDPFVRPKQAEIPWSNPQAVDLFHITPTTSPPWDVQCSIVDRLKSDVIREKDAQKKAQSHLQLSLCYYNGFGCTPETMACVQHLDEARNHNTIAEALFAPVLSALERNTRISGRVDAPLAGLEDMAINSKAPTTGYCVRLRSLLRSHACRTDLQRTTLHGRRLSGEDFLTIVRSLDATTNATSELRIEQSGETASSVSLLDYLAAIDQPQALRHLIEVCDFENVELKLLLALNLSCKAGLFDNACAIAKKCTGLHIPWSKVWPTPMHWLIMFPRDEAAILADTLLETSSGTESIHRLTSMVDFELHSHEVVYVPELALDLFGSPLHWAVRVGNADLATLLMDLGANVNQRWRREPLMDNDLERRESLSYSPLDIAAVWHHHELTKLLLVRGATRYGGDHWDKHEPICLVGQPVRPFARFAIHGRDSRRALEQTIAVLKDSGCSLETQNSSGETALQRAFDHVDQDKYILEVLIEAGSSGKDLFQNCGTNAVAVAAKGAAIRRCSIARLDLALYLVDDVNAADYSGKNALYYAAEAASPMMVERLLIDDRVRVDGRFGGTEPAINAAARAGALEVVRLLLEVGASVDGFDSDGRSPLEHALESRQAAMAALLIHAGALLIFASQSTRKSDEGNSNASVQMKGSTSSSVRSTALILATANRTSGVSILPELVEACEELRTKTVIDVSDSQDWTALHHAVWFGDYDGVRALVAAGATTDYSSNNGLPSKRRMGTPLDVAKRLLGEYTKLGSFGWKLNSIQWLAKGSAIGWKIYLGNLEKIIALLQ